MESGSRRQKAKQNSNGTHETPLHPPHGMEPHRMKRFRVITLRLAEWARPESVDKLFALHTLFVSLFLSDSYSLSLSASLSFLRTLTPLTSSYSGKNVLQPTAINLLTLTPEEPSWHYIFQSLFFTPNVNKFTCGIKWKRNNKLFGETSFRLMSFSLSRIFNEKIGKQKVIY